MTTFFALISKILTALKEQLVLPIVSFNQSPNALSYLLSHKLIDINEYEAWITPKGFHWDAELEKVIL